MKKYVVSAFLFTLIACSIDNSASKDQAKVGITSTASSIGTGTQTAAATVTAISIDSNTESSTLGSDSSTVGATSSSTCTSTSETSSSFAMEVRACLAQGHLYNPSTRQCAKIPKATFLCTFDILFDVMKNLGIKPTSQLESAKAEGADVIEILGCGLSLDAKRVAVQYVKNSTDSNSNCPTNKWILFHTGCFGPEISDEGEKASRVSECLDAE